jgi:peptidoglycan/LPS O-acetylase OafA/YrhL
MGQSIALGERALPRHLVGRITGYFAMTRSAGAIAELDGLRGIAILLVLLRHGSRLFVRDGQAGLQVSAGWLGTWDAASPLINGWMGVELFFVLSGFLITHHILKRSDAGKRSIGVRRYMAKRALRIVPAYYAFLAVVVLGWIPAYAVSDAQLAERVGYHLLFLQDYLPPDIVVAFWSLGVEEKFYFLAPFLVIGVVRAERRETRLALLGLLFFAPLLFRAATYLALSGPLSYDTSFFALRSPFHLSADALIVGTACAFVYHAHRRGEWRIGPAAATWLFWGGAATVGVLLCSHRLLDRVSWFDATLLFSILSLGFGAVLLGLVLHRGRYAGFFQGRTLFFFSKISYSLYLVHMVFLASTYALVDGWIGLDRFPVWFGMLVYLPIFGAVSVLASLLLHYAVEKPFLLLKDRI